jgi:hypothetical protein
MTVQERIIFAKTRQMTQLDLSDCALTEIPEEVFELTQLRTLILGKNYQSSEDSSRRNRITFLPLELSLLKNLEGIGLGFNDLTDFPIVLTNLPRLQTLMLNGNPLTILSPEISQVRHLRILGLGNTGLIELPEAIGELRRLKVLGLANNQLSSLPHSIKKLQFLEQLGLAGNRLKAFPIETLRLQELQVLGLANNQIQDFPKEILELKRLQKLDLKDNPLPAQVISIAAKGHQGIQQYYFQKANQRKKLLQNIIEGKKEATERANLKDRLFRFIKSGSTICSVCDGKKTVNGYIGHLNMRFKDDKCFGCEGQGFAEEDEKEIHQLLDRCNQKKERCRDIIMHLVQEEQTFSRKIRAQRPNHDILFEETRRSIMDILNKKRQQIETRVRQFSAYQLFEQKILISLYNVHLYNITLKERFGSDEFSMDYIHPSTNLYGISQSIEAILNEHEMLFDELMEANETTSIQRISERLQVLAEELKQLQ